MFKMPILKVVYISLLTVFLMQTSYAASTNTVMQVSRYQTVAEKPSTAQIHLLSQTIQMRFPQNIQTVGAAMTYVLRYSGYSLVPYTQMSQSLRNTLTMSLPAVDRNFGPMSLRDALTTLAGPAFDLVQNKLNRTVNFRVKAAFLPRTEQSAKPTVSS